jgi:hypothetical protein
MAEGEEDQRMTIIDPYTQAPIAPVQPEPEPTPGRGSLNPSPGRLLVMREPVLPYYERNGIRFDKTPDVIEMEEARNIFATVVAIGAHAPNGPAPWFQRGDVVTIEPSMFREIELIEGKRVELGPFAAVTGVFSSPED